MAEGYLVGEPDLNVEQEQPAVTKDCVAVAIGQTCPACGYNRQEPKFRYVVHPVK